MRQFGADYEIGNLSPSWGQVAGLLLIEQMIACKAKVEAVVLPELIYD